MIKFVTKTTKFLSAFLFLILNYSFIPQNDLPTFRTLSFEEAEKMALKEGKPLFVDFYASWCGPCKWMEESTFQDPEIRRILNEDYIAVKIDIDEFDGFNIKTKYDVRYLPTIMIFQNGRVVERVEETLGISKLSKLLENHKLFTTNRNKQVTNKSPKTIPEAAKSSHKKPNLIQETQLSAGEVAHNFIKSSNGYKLQVGAFAKEEGAITVQTELQKHFVEPITVIQDYIGSKSVTKIYFGHFNTKEDADEYKKKIKAYTKLDAIVMLN